MSTVTVTDEVLGTFLTDYLGIEEGSDSESVEETRISLINLTRSSRQPAYQNILVGAHLLCRFKILDVACDMMEFPHFIAYAPVERLPPPEEHNDRLELVLAGLQDWPKILFEFQELHMTHRAREQEVLVSRQENLEGLTREQIYFHTAMHNLQQAHTFDNNRKYNKVMFNIEILIFCIWYFGAVSVSAMSVFVPYS